MNLVLLQTQKIILMISATVCLASFLGCESKQRSYSNSLKTPEEVVRVFCDLDASGTRLSSSTWWDIVPYITWREEAMESAVVIISGYNLTHINKAEHKAEILVEYKVVGKYWDRRFSPGSSIEKISFNVIKTDTGWKITNLGTTVPHIYPQIFLAGLESRAATAAEERDTESLEQLRKDISLARKITNHNHK
jgi:hypothetical protein